MIRQFASKASLFVLGLTALVAAVPAHAQVSYMKVDVPFAFTAGKTTLPAGQYGLQVDERTRILEIESASGAKYSVLLSPSADMRSNSASGSGVLRFQKVDGQYYLGEVWRPSQQAGNRLPMPKGANERAAAYSDSVVDVTIR